MSLTSAIYSRLNNYLSLYDALKEISTQFDTSIQEVALFVLHDELLMWLTSYYKQEYWHIENFNTFGNGDYQLQENERFKTKEILKRVENEFFFDDYILDSELYGNPSLTDKQKACLSDLKQVNYYYEKRELAEYNFNGKYLKFEGIESNKSLVTPSEPQAGKIKAFNELIELGEHQLLMKDYPSFTPHELACFLSDKDPDYINNNNFTDFNLSERLVYKSLSNGYLSKNDNDEIKAQQAKEYLYSIGKIYKGFNDNLSPVIADRIGHATITQTMPTDSQLSQQVADLNAQLASATNTIASLQEKLQQNNFDRLESYNFHIAELHRVKTESNQYQKENESLKAKLEENQPSQSDTPADGEPLALVFDSTNANYAPDLVHALNLWLDLYHRNPKDSDRHTNKANIWLKNNTAYEYVERGDTAMNRIREIATPLKDFGQQRAKEPKK